MNKDKVNYKVDVENRVVIATIDGCEFDALNKINVFIDNVTSHIDFEPSNYIIGKYIMPYSFKAVVKCSNDDNFDPDIGKRKALNRLIDKYEKSLNKRLANFVVDMDKVLNNISDNLNGKEF